MPAVRYCKPEAVYQQNFRKTAQDPDITAKGDSGPQIHEQTCKAIVQQGDEDSRQQAYGKSCDTGKQGIEKQVKLEHSHYQQSERFIEQINNKRR
jgi:hypothetical protein